MTNQNMANQCKNDMRKYLSLAKSSSERSCRESWLKLALMMRRHSRGWSAMN